MYVLFYLKIIIISLEIHVNKIIKKTMTAQIRPGLVRT